MSADADNRLRFAQENYQEYQLGEKVVAARVAGNEALLALIVARRETRAALHALGRAYEAAEATGRKSGLAWRTPWRQAMEGVHGMSAAITSLETMLSQSGENVIEFLEAAGDYAPSWPDAPEIAEPFPDRPFPPNDRIVRRVIQQESTE